MGVLLQFKGYTFVHTIGSTTVPETTTYTITVNKTGYTVSGAPSSVASGGTFTFTLTLMSGYTDVTPTATMSGGTVSVTGSDGVWTISCSNVTGNVVVTANATATSGGDSGGESGGDSGGTDTPDTTTNLVTEIKDGYWKSSINFVSNNGDTVQNWISTNAFLVESGKSVRITGIEGSTVRLRGWESGNVTNYIYSGTNVFIPTDGYVITPSVDCYVTINAACGGAVKPTTNIGGYVFASSDDFSKVKVTYM